MRCQTHMPYLLRHLEAGRLLQPLHAVAQLHPLWHAEVLCRPSDSVAPARARACRILVILKVISQASSQMVVENACLLREGCSRHQEQHVFWSVTAENPR